MIFFSFYRVQWTGISLFWLQLFYVPTTELEGLLWYPVIFTGSLQGRITTQGDPCNLYRERVCSVCMQTSRKRKCCNCLVVSKELSQQSHAIYPQVPCKHLNGNNKARNWRWLQYSPHRLLRKLVFKKIPLSGTLWIFRSPCSPRCWLPPFYLALRTCNEGEQRKSRASA